MLTTAANDWPAEAGARAYYGDPTNHRDPGKASASWEAAHLVYIPIPWRAEAAWDAGLRIRRLRIHRKCADSLSRVLAEIWASAAGDQAVIEEWGCHKIGGTYIYRPKRNGLSLSMHAYGCAIDLDPERNKMGDILPNFALCGEVRNAFLAEGWKWGGYFSRPDGMHWEATS